MIKKNARIYNINLKKEFSVGILLPIYHKNIKDDFDFDEYEDVIGTGQFGVVIRATRTRKIHNNNNENNNKKKQKKKTKHKKKFIC